MWGWDEKKPQNKTQSDVHDEASSLERARRLPCKLEVVGDHRPDHFDPNLPIITLRPLKDRSEWQRHRLSWPGGTERAKQTHVHPLNARGGRGEEAAFLEWREMFAKPAVSILTVRLFFLVLLKKK